MQQYALKSAALCLLIAAVFQYINNDRGRQVRFIVFIRGCGICKLVGASYAAPSTLSNNLATELIFKDNIRIGYVNSGGEVVLDGQEQSTFSTFRMLLPLAPAAIEVSFLLIAILLFILFSPRKLAQQKARLKGT